MHLNNDLLARRKRKYWRLSECDFLCIPRARERKINSDFLALFGFFLCAAAKLFVLHSSTAALSQPNENNKTAGFKILISNLENKTRPRAWLDARFCFCLF